MAIIGTEIKFTLPADQVPAGLAAFGLRESDADVRAIYFVDRANHAGDPWLFRHHVILRARRDPDGSGDVTVKLRPAVADRLTGRWRPGIEHRADYRVELDWAREKVLAASVEEKIDSNIEALLAGPRKRTFSHEQQDFLRRCGPELDTPMRDLRNLGPVAALRWKDIEAGRVTGLRAERWTWHGDRTFLELSLRCAGEDEATEQRALLVAELQKLGLELDDSAITKTEAVLRDLL